MLVCVCARMHARVWVFGSTSSYPGSDEAPFCGMNPFAYECARLSLSFERDNKRSGPLLKVRAMLPVCPSVCLFVFVCYFAPSGQHQGVVSPQEGSLRSRMQMNVCRIHIYVFIDVIFSLLK